MTDCNPTRHDVRLNPAKRRVWPTVDGMPSRDFSLPHESRVAIAGDWESRTNEVHATLDRLRRTAPDIQTILHLGDLRYSYPSRRQERDISPREGFVSWLDGQLNTNGIRRLILTPGNHEWWQQLHAEFTRHPERPYRISPRIWILPRGFRFLLAGRDFLSFGGAASLERGPADKTWTRHEVADETDVRGAATDGQCDVLLLHEALNDPMPEVLGITEKPSKWSSSRLRASAQSRSLVTALRDLVQPRISFHGHMHVSGSFLSNETATYSFADAGQPRNIGLLELDQLRFRWLDDLERPSPSSPSQSRSPAPNPEHHPRAPGRHR